MIRRLLPPLFALMASAAIAGTAAAGQRIYSYDPADAATRASVGTGLTFVFDRGMFGMRVHQILATEARASVMLEPIAERQLGARLDRILPAGSGARDLYLISDREQGEGMVRAFCPGSTKGWLVFTPIRPRGSLVVHAVGNDPAGGAPKLCTTLRFTFRGEWRAPPMVKQMTMPPFEPPRPPF